MSEAITGPEATKWRGTKTNGKRRHRPLKWPTVFGALRAAVSTLEGGNRPQAIEDMGRASTWAAKWAGSGRYREETSMGVTLAEAIEENVVHPLAAGATAKQLQQAISVLEKVVAREAKVAAVQRAQSHLRLRFRGKTPDEARERAVAAALRQIRSALDEE